MQLDLQCTLLADGHAEHAGNSQSSDSKDNGGVIAGGLDDSAGRSGDGVRSGRNGLDAGSGSTVLGGIADSSAGVGVVVGGGGRNLSNNRTGILCAVSGDIGGDNDLGRIAGVDLSLIHI